MRRRKNSKTQKPSKAREPFGRSYEAPHPRVGDDDLDLRVWQARDIILALFDRADRTGISWRQALQARRLALVALGALCGQADAIEEIDRIDAFLTGVSGPDSPVLRIREMADRVSLAAWHKANPKAAPEASEKAAENLRRILVSEYGDAVPSVEDLDDWLGRWSRRGARGKLTTAGIVARIIHRGRLVGARGENESKTLRRVTEALVERTE